MSVLRCLLHDGLENSFIYRKPSRGKGSTCVYPDLCGVEEISLGLKGLPSAYEHLVPPRKP